MAFSLVSIKGHKLARILEVYAAITSVAQKWDCFSSNDALSDFDFCDEQISEDADSLSTATLPKLTKSQAQNSTTSASRNRALARGTSPQNLLFIFTWNPGFP